MSALPVHGQVAEEATSRTDASQRWRNGRHSFVPTHLGGFDPKKYSVNVLEYGQARDFVGQHHYAKSMPSAKVSYGLHLDTDEDPLVGVAVFSVPMRAEVITNVFPDLDVNTGVELGRLVLEGPPAGTRQQQRAPANAESWFIARCLEDLASRGVQGVVSFADPVPRRSADGSVIKPGHVGVVYQACMKAYGRGTARHIIVLADGSSITDRALQKVRAQESGHGGVERRLIALGASVPRAGEDMRQWLTGALEDVNARRIKHSGNHRYAVAVGATRAQRRAVRISAEQSAFIKTAESG